jgi:hypothetical protein
MFTMFSCSNDFIYDAKTYEVELLEDWGESTLR